MSPHVTDRTGRLSTMEELLATAERLADLGSFEVRLPSEERRWSPGFFRVHGLDPQGEPSLERLLERIHPADRTRVEAIVRAATSDPASLPPEGVRVNYRVVLPDGTTRRVRSIGRADRDGEDGGGRWYGIVQDVTEQLMTERDLRVHHAVARALEAWEQEEDGLVALLRRLAQALDYPAGALWTWDSRRERIVCRTIWTDPDAGVAEWAAIAHQLEFGLGEGIPGRVWQTCEPAFVPDVAEEPAFIGPDEAVGVGLRSLLAFAATPDGVPLAVLSFYSFDRRTPNPRLVQTLAAIGSQLGRFLDRRRGQLDRGPLSERELEILQLAAEGLSGPKIAQQLFVSPSTVKTHFENIYEKLGVSDRAGAVALGLRTGLIS